MTARLPFQQVLGCFFYIFNIFLHIFSVYSPIFKIFSVVDIKIKFPVFKGNNHDGQTAFLAGFRLFINIFNTFFHIFSVYGPIFQIFKVFKDLKINFFVVLRNNHGGQTAFYQVFSYFYMFYIFPKLFVYFDPIFKLFWDISIKTIFLIVMNIFNIIYFDHRHHTK